MDNKEQKEKIISLAKLTADAGKLYSDCLKNIGDLAENKKQILALEAEGDKLQDALDDNFANEKNIPYLALDRANLVRRLDDILDQFTIAVRTFEAFRSGLSDKFYDSINSIADNCASITKCLAKGVEVIYSSFNEALNVAKEIEEVRDKATSTAFQMEADTFSAANPNDGWKEYEASNRVLERTMKIISHTKEASEVLQIMSLKYD